jgi:hypothetical protein
MTVAVAGKPSRPLTLAGTAEVEDDPTEGTDACASAPSRLAQSHISLGPRAQNRDWQPRDKLLYRVGWKCRGV